MLKNTNSLDYTVTPNTCQLSGAAENVKPRCRHRRGDGDKAKQYLIQSTGKMGCRLREAEPA